MDSFDLSCEYLKRSSWLDTSKKWDRRWWRIRNFNAYRGSAIFFLPVSASYPNSFRRQIDCCRLYQDRSSCFFFGGWSTANRFSCIGYITTHNRCTVHTTTTTVLWLHYYDIEYPKNLDGSLHDFHSHDDFGCFNAKFFLCQKCSFVTHGWITANHVDWHYSFFTSHPAHINRCNTVRLIQSIAQNYFYHSLLKHNSYRLFNSSCQYQVFLS